jgi:Kef-type K+ transport system membrane component KefB
LAASFAPAFHARFSPNGIGTIPFSLFLGVSMSITAFPVLARILDERKMQTNSIGATALLCAAVDDVAAWMLLAVAMTFIAHNSNGPGLYVRFLWLGLYVAAMLFIIRPLARWLTDALHHARSNAKHLGASLAHSGCAINRLWSIFEAPGNPRWSSPSEFLSSSLDLETAGQCMYRACN